MAETPSSKHSTLTVKGRAIRIRTIAVGALVVLAVWFVAANTDSVEIKLWIPTVTMPLWLVLSLTLVVGFVVGFFVARRLAARNSAGPGSTGGR